MKVKWVIHVLARCKRQSVDTLTVYSLFGRGVTLHLEALTLHIPNIKSACQFIYESADLMTDIHTGLNLLSLPLTSQVLILHHTPS